MCVGAGASFFKRRDCSTQQYFFLLLLPNSSIAGGDLHCYLSFLHRDKQDDYTSTNAMSTSINGSIAASARHAAVATRLLFFVLGSMISIMLVNLFATRSHMHFSDRC